MSTPLESRATEIVRDHHFVLWRLPMLAALLGLGAGCAPSLAAWLASAVPLTLGMLAIYVLPPRRLETWISRGLLLGADALLCGLALYAASPAAMITRANSPNGCSAIRRRTPLWSVVSPPSPIAIISASVPIRK